MRNARPLHVGHVRALGDGIVGLVQAAVEFAERLRRQRLARLVHLVGLLFELREQRLAEHRGAEALQQVVEDVGALLGIRLHGEQIAGQQHLVDGGSHLGDKDGVLVVDVVLGLGGEPGVHGVAQLVGQGERVVVLVGVVQQHVGVHAVHAAGVRAGGLALVLVHVDPALAEGALEKHLVRLAQRLGGLQNQLLGGLVGHGAVHLVHQRHIQVVQPQRVKTQLLFANLQIAGQRRNRLVHAIDQVLIERLGHVVAVQLGLQCAGMPARLGIVAVQLHVAGVERGQGVDVLLVLAEVLLKGLPAHIGVLRLPVLAEQRVGQGLAAVQIRELHVHALEEIEGLFRGLGRVAQHRQQALLVLAEGVLPGAADVLDHVAVGLHFRLGDPRFQLLRVDGEDLRAEGRGDGGEIHEQPRGARLHLLGLRVAVVLGGVQHGVDVHQLQLLRSGKDAIQALLQRLGGAAQRTHDLRQRRNQLSGLLQRPLPGGNVLKNIAQIPAKCRIHLFSGLFHFLLAFLHCNLIEECRCNVFCRKTARSLHAAGIFIYLSVHSVRRGEGTPPYGCLCGGVGTPPYGYDTAPLRQSASASSCVSTRTPYSFSTLQARSCSDRRRIIVAPRAGVRRKE